MRWDRAVRRYYLRLSPRAKVQVALVLGLSASNAVGILVVLALLTLVVPMSQADRDLLLAPGSVAMAFGFLLAAAPIGVLTAWRVLHPVVALLGRPGGSPADPPTAHEQRAVLDSPRRIFWRQAALWGLAAALATAAYATVSTDLALSVLLVIGLAGWTTSSLTYLVAERSLRPVARQVLMRGFPRRRSIRSVADRAMFAWALGTGVTALGTVLVGVVALSDRQNTTMAQLAVTTVVMGTLTLTVGFVSTYAAAQASSEPIGNLRDALAEVERGDLDVEVGIYDGTEIGMLQAGFNRMMEGLREREELRDLFGRHVGADVARAALEGGVRLGGEVREIAVLFVDIIGSTSLAQERPPGEVLDLLNRFFDVVVEVVHEYDGWVNKFEGDAVLAVWGAPVDVADRDTAALTAARVLGQQLAEELPEISAGIGVARGSAVAGNVGTHERYEYTVVGDPVNVAARLTGEAKRAPRRVVASQLLVAAADPAEAALWHELEPIVVRGRSGPTRIATPL